MKGRVWGLWLLVWAGAVGAEADGPDHWMLSGLEPGDGLALRAEPTFKGQVLDRLPHRVRCLKNLGCVGGLDFESYQAASPDERAAAERAEPRWCQVEYNGHKGWVPARYLKEETGPCGPPIRSDELDGLEPVVVEGYRVDSAMARPGGDYRQLFLPDFQACAEHCSRQARCRAFDYFPDSGRCLLKTLVPPPWPAPRAISGVKFQR